MESLKYDDYFTSYTQTDPPEYNNFENFKIEDYDTFDPDVYGKFKSDEYYNKLKKPNKMEYTVDISDSFYNTQSEDTIQISTPVDNTPVNVPSNGKFKNKKDFFKAMNTAYKKVLAKNNMDPNWAYMLTAAAGVESGYGAHLAGNFNYGGVKVTSKQIKDGVSYSTKVTTDYIPGKGNVRRAQNFRNYKSIEDYCQHIVDLLRNKRYGKVFSLYDSSNPLGAWEYILRAGYGGGSETNIRNYINMMRQNLPLIKSL